MFFNWPLYITKLSSDSVAPINALSLSGFITCLIFLRNTVVEPKKLSNANMNIISPSVEFLTPMPNEYVSGWMPKKKYWFYWPKISSMFTKRRDTRAIMIDSLCFSYIIDEQDVRRKFLFKHVFFQGLSITVVYQQSQLWQASFCM